MTIESSAAEMFSERASAACTTEKNMHLAQDAGIPALDSPPKVPRTTNETQRTLSFFLGKTNYRLLKRKDVPGRVEAKADPGANCFQST